MKCEDYPCCGHTPLDPCEPQWYDAPGAFDVSRPGNEHALCDHQAGICEVEEPDPDDDDDDEPDHDCPVWRFLDDPITRAYGIGSDFIENGNVTCDICRQRELDAAEPPLSHWR